MQDLIISLLGKVPTIQDVVVALLTLLGALTIVVSVIAKYTATKIDDEVVGKAKELLIKAVLFLPSIGIKTEELKKLIEVLETTKAKDDASKAS